jgi:CheY-like chemotaxis protein
MGMSNLIYIADDNAIFLSLLQKILQKENKYTIRVFSDGQELIEELDQNPMAIVLDYFFDTSHPNAKNGKEIFNIIKAKGYEGIPVIFVSVTYKKEIFSELMSMGAALCVSKKDINAIGEIKKFLDSVLVS